MPTAYFILFFNLPVIILFQGTIKDLRNLYYPIRVRLDGSLTTLVCAVSNRSIMTYFCSDCQGII